MKNARVNHAFFTDSTDFLRFSRKGRVFSQPRRAPKENSCLPARFHFHKNCSYYNISNLHNQLFFATFSYQIANSFICT